MSDVLRRARLLLFVLLCCAGTGIAAVQALNAGNELSSADAYSEANVLREVDGFRAQGFWHDAGLGNVLFGNRYPKIGFTTAPSFVLAHSVGPGGVYTHYPPGPEWIAFVAESVLGDDPVSRLRVVPLVIGAIAAIFFGLSVRQRFGSAAGWLTMLLSLGAAPFWNANGHLHCLGYAQSLLLVEIGVCLGRRQARAPALLLGFAQGWLSFDFFFEVALVPIAVACAGPLISPAYQPRWRLALWRSALATAGFALAHFLHLGQVVAFHGSVSAALADLGGAAAYRNGMGQMQGALGYLTAVGDLFAWHLVSPYPVRPPLVDDFRHLFSGNAAAMASSGMYRAWGVSLLPFWAVMAVTFCLVDAMIAQSGDAPRRLTRRWALVGILGVLVSSLWWVAMPSHALGHTYLHYRHLNLCFALWTVFLAVQLAEPLRRWAALRPGTRVAPPGSSASRLCAVR